MKIREVKDIYNTVQRYETGVSLRSCMQNVNNNNIVCTVNGKTHLLDQKLFTHMLDTYMAECIQDCRELGIEL